MAFDYLDAIRNSRVYEVAERTPLEFATKLSERLGQNVLLKREDLQAVFSFKLRGAYNRVAALNDEEKSRGVVCSSAGNHGQGVALAGRTFGVRAVIVMPITTARIKVDAVKRLGGEVMLRGNTYDDAYNYARELANEKGMVFIHPFDDPLVIAGQGTVAMELLEQHPGPIHAIFVPVGGGGLISGIAAWIKGNRPEIKVIGVEPVDSCGMYTSLKAGKPVTLDHVGMFSDGVAVKRIGDETFRLCQELVDDIVLVDTDETCAAIQDVFDATRTVVEPAGALAVAGLKKYSAGKSEKGQTLIAINSGANMNFARLRHVAERAAIGEGLETLLAVEIPEHPGSFLEFCQAIGARPVTEFNYRYGSASSARIFVGVELQRGGSERAELIADLKARNYPAIDLSNNELAVLHVRHMVGGGTVQMENERIMRVEFPERPGALMDFLQAVGSRWNISLFHYRNHGSDYGRVLVGIQAADADLADLHAHLDRLQYPWFDESDNPAYQIFLSGDWPTQPASETSA